MSFMTEQHKQELVALARQHIKPDDRSHDLLHALRILKLTEEIGTREGGDPDILIPAALFHDLVMYPKNDPRSSLASIHSADQTRELLSRLDWYPAEKIPAVAQAIERCSFTKQLPKERLEEYILQDADLLESVGAISIARTFSSSGHMGRQFYDVEDPTAQARPISPKDFALDLFPGRLFIAAARLHTKTAKRLGRRRDKFLHKFYQEFLDDIDGK